MYIKQLEIETEQTKHQLKQLVLRKDNRKKSLPVATQEKPIRKVSVTIVTLVDRYGTEIKVGAKVKFLTSGGFKSTEGVVSRVGKRVTTSK